MSITLQPPEKQTVSGKTLFTIIAEIGAGKFDSSLFEPYQGRTNGRNWFIYSANFFVEKTAENMAALELVMKAAEYDVEDLTNSKAPIYIPNEFDKYRDTMPFNGNCIRFSASCFTELRTYCGQSKEQPITLDKEPKGVKNVVASIYIGLATSGKYEGSMQGILSPNLYFLDGIDGAVVDNAATDFDPFAPEGDDIPF